MSPAAGDLLVEHIAPRLRSAIPNCVYPVGAEDAEELVQDAIVIAAKMLDNVERSGKSVTPGNIALLCDFAYEVRQAQSVSGAHGCNGPRHPA